MAQGAVKKGAKPQSSSHKAKKHAAASGSTGAPKRGARVTKAPKRITAIKSQQNTNKIMKKFSSGLISKTEKMLGERAGHLELIGPGKKHDPKTKDKKATTTGGSRKFG